MLQFFFVKLSRKKRLNSLLFDIRSMVWCVRTCIRMEVPSSAKPVLKEFALVLMWPAHCNLLQMNSSGPR
jgi:hypothetical protein